MWVSLRLGVLLALRLFVLSAAPPPFVLPDNQNVPLESRGVLESRKSTVAEACIHAPGFSTFGPTAPTSSLALRALTAPSLKNLLEWKSGNRLADERNVPTSAISHDKVRKKSDQESSRERRKTATVSKGLATGPKRHGFKAARLHCKLTNKEPPPLSTQIIGQLVPKTTSGTYPDFSLTRSPVPVSILIIKPIQATIPAAETTTLSDGDSSTKNESRITFDKLYSDGKEEVIFVKFGQPSSTRSLEAVASLSFESTGEMTLMNAVLLYALKTPSSQRTKDLIKATKSPSEGQKAFKVLSNIVSAIISATSPNNPNPTAIRSLMDTTEASLSKTTVDELFMATLNWTFGDLNDADTEAVGIAVDSKLSLSDVFKSHLNPKPNVLVTSGDSAMQLATRYTLSDDELELHEDSRFPHGDYVYYATKGNKEPSSKTVKKATRSSFIVE